MLEYLSFRVSVPKNEVQFIVHVVPEENRYEDVLHVVFQAMELFYRKKPLQVGVLQSVDYPQFGTELVDGSREQGVQIREGIVLVCLSDLRHPDVTLPLILGNAREGKVVLYEGRELENLD